MAQQRIFERDRSAKIYSQARAYLLMSLFVLVSLLPGRSAVALNLEMHRFDRRFVTDFVVVSEGRAIGVVRRHRWCQLWRRSYIYEKDNNGPISTAKQEFNTMGTWYPWAASFTLLDKYGEPVARMRAHHWTWLAAMFDLTDLAGRPLASLRIDDHAQLLTISPPATRLPVWGTLTRVQQASLGRDRWDLSVDEGQFNLSPEMWPPLIAFFAESFGTLGRSWVDG